MFCFLPKYKNGEKGNVSCVLVRTSHLADWSQTYKKNFLPLIPWQNKIKVLFFLLTLTFTSKVRSLPKSGVVESQLYSEMLEWDEKDFVGTNFFQKE
jgi:hypothetical protein